MSAAPSIPAPMTYRTPSLATGLELAAPVLGPSHSQSLVPVPVRDRGTGGIAMLVDVGPDFDLGQLGGNRAVPKDRAGIAVGAQEVPLQLVQFGLVGRPVAGVAGQEHAVAPNNGT